MKNRRSGLGIIEALVALGLLGVGLAAVLVYTRTLQRQAANARMQNELDFSRLSLNNLLSRPETCRDLFQNADGTRVVLPAPAAAASVSKLAINDVALFQVGARIDGGARIMAIRVLPFVAHNDAAIENVAGTPYRRRPATVSLTVVPNEASRLSEAATTVSLVTALYTDDNRQIITCRIDDDASAPVNSFCDFIDGEIVNGQCRLPGLYFGGFFQLGDNRQNGVAVPYPYNDTLRDVNGNALPNPVLSDPASVDRFCESPNPLNNNRCGCPAGFTPQIVNAVDEPGVGTQDTNYVCVQR